MANVKVKVLVAFTYKGDQYEVGDEATVSVQYAAQLNKLNYIKLDSDAKEKVNKVVAKQEKNDNAGPGK